MERRTNIYKKEIITLVAILAMFIGFIPVCFILDNYIGNMNYIIIYMALSLGLGLYVGTLKCPRCRHQLFRGRSLYSPIPHKECPNCKLNLNKYYFKKDL
jgi:hypothetical protein